MTATATLAQQIAFDIVATAEQYPAIREARTFSALHDAYDANESILAGITRHYPEDTDPTVHVVLDECNAATDEIDGILRLAGFPGLVMFVAGKFQTRTVTLDIPATFSAEVVVDVSVPGNPRALKIERFIVSPVGGNGAAVDDDNVPELVEKAVVGYWNACNDGTWPLDKIDWEE